MRAEPLDLFSQPSWLVNPGSDLERRFAEFHALNPHIMDELRTRVMRLVNAGRKRVGIALIFESMRYDSLISTTGSEWKLDNSFRSLFARLLIHEMPELADVIELRERKQGNAA